MSNIFNSVHVPEPKRNVFSLSHELKTTFEMGNLVPILHLDVLPKDKIRCNTEVFLRFAPMLSPVMHRVDLYTHFFFVPYRLLWKEWENFITGGPDGTSAPVFPTITFDKLSYLRQGSLADHLGIKWSSTMVDGPNDPNITARVSAMPFRAYNFIWNEYYRDQNLSKPIDIFEEESGNLSADFYTDTNNTSPDFNNVNFFNIRNRCWAKDYFTSALPWTQRGPEMSLPIAGNAPVKFNWKSPDKWYEDVYPTSGASSIVTPSDQVGEMLNFIPGGNMTYQPSRDTRVLGVDNSANLSADLSQSSPVTVNELRRTLAIQRWLEANARGGSRYIEQLLMHFGVAPQDARLQRPIFLGGGKSPVVISEVLQQSASSINGSDTPLATMAGRATSSQAQHSFTYEAPEHGMIIGILSVMPKASYSQGIPRQYLKTDKFDFAWPELAHLGEQEIWDAELFANNNNTFNPSDSVFGYTPRYAEYKFAPDEIAGEFRSTLNFWHLGRNLGGAALNEQFVTCDPSTRIFAVTKGSDDSSVYNHMWSQIYFDIRAIRCLPKYGTPSI